MPVRVLTIFGTRPEAIKLAPVIVELRGRGDVFDVQVVNTGQHRELLAQVLQTFYIETDLDLRIMTPDQDPLDVLSRSVLSLRPCFAETPPDLVLVQGDTTTTLAAAIAAAHHRVPVGHVEAGMRSGSALAPFPEEHNRRLTSHLASYHFAATERARGNLLREGIPDERITVTGNTVIDALLRISKHLARSPVDLGDFTPGLDWETTRVILVTGHRRESFGQGFGEICDGLDRLAERNPDVHIVYPVHLNPHVHDVIHARLGERANVHLIPPVDYLPFVQMMAQCHLILTDSGGIQEEAPSLGKPVLVMRERTERPETIDVGAGRLVGTDSRRIVEETERLIHDSEAHAAMVRTENPHGDGHAAERIADFLQTHLPLTLE